jgi:hypothetical protein
MKELEMHTRGVSRTIGWIHSALGTRFKYSQENVIRSAIRRFLRYRNCDPSDHAVEVSELR